MEKKMKDTANFIWTDVKFSKLNYNFKISAIRNFSHANSITPTGMISEFQNIDFIN